MNNNFLRVFLSSTFVGLEKEREYLVSKIFPVLKTNALKRNVTLVPLDLRWGVTKEQAEQGKIIWICLNEILKSKPFFIGILGKRYGWRPNLDILKKDTQLEVSFPSLRKDLENKLSMTEIEIQHAVLRNKEKMHAYFYATDSSDIEPEQKALLEAIKKDGRYGIKYYHSSEDLGALVEEDFNKLIEDLFPVANKSELTNIQDLQRAELTQLTRFFVERDNISSAIDKFINSNSYNCLALYGDKGSGKSCVIANWFSNNPKNTIYYFVGSTLSDKHVEAIHNYLTESISALIGKDVSLFENKSSSYDKLVSLLDVLAYKKDNYIIVLDGINEVVEDKETIHSPLYWLPEFPSNVKLIVSTNSLEQKQTLENRNALIKQVGSLSVIEREELIKLYLETYAKTLKQDDIEKLATDPKSSDTTTLSFMLNEMVYDSVFETVDVYLTQYFLSKNKFDFYDGLINRAEQKYANNLVTNILGLIYLSRAGLKIEEIVGVLNLSPLEWSQFYCSYSYLFIEHNGLISIKSDEITDIVKKKTLSENNRVDELEHSLITFFENKLSVLKKNDNRSITAEEAAAFIKCETNISKPTEEDICLYINSYCTSSYLFANKERCFEELTNLYYRKSSWERLYEQLLYPVCFVHMQRFHFESLKQYWTSLMEHNQNMKVLDYPIMDDETTYTDVFISDYYYSLALLVNSDLKFGNSENVAFYLRKSIHHMELTNVPIKGMFLIPRYNSLGNIYSDRKEYELALDCFKKTAEFAKGDDYYSKASKIQVGQNYVQKLMDLGHYEEGIYTCEQLITEIQEAELSSLELNLFLKNIYEIQGNLYAQKANSLSDSHYTELSIQSLKKAEEKLDVLMMIDDNKYLMDCVKVITNLAISYYESDMMEEAYDYFIKAEDLITKSNRHDSNSLECLAQIKMNVGAMLTDWLDTEISYYDKAFDELKESCSLYTDLYEKDMLRFSIPFGDAVYNFARLLRRTRQPQEAIGLYNKALDLLADDRPKRAQCLLALGLAYNDIGESIHARNVIKQSITLFQRLYEETGFPYYIKKIDSIKNAFNI